MKFVLEGNSIKVFGKALQALSRVGEELWFDPTVKGLALRSVNTAQSAYSCFLFSPLFFELYSLGSGSGQCTESIKCKLIMKAVLPLFRCLTSVELKVERCQISISSHSDRLIIQFFCRHGITRTHNLHFHESEPLQAVFASHLCPNVFKAPARLLGDMVMHFHTSQEEITLSTTPLRVSLRNYYEEGSDHMKMLLTEMTLHPDEFDYFKVGVDSDITFCLKELRGFLSFAEAHCLPVSVHFDSAGKPACFFVEDIVLEATVVLATLVKTGNRDDCQATGTPAPGTPAPGTPGPGTPRHGSNQSRPVIEPPALTQLLPQTHSCGGLGEPEEAYASGTATPSSTPICSLLFRALSSEQDIEGCPAVLPVLACHSDSDEAVADDNARSPRL